VKWTLFGRDDMDKLRSSLEAHKSALDIALDMVALYVNPWVCWAIAKSKFVVPLLVKLKQIPRRFETIHRQSRKTLPKFSLKLRGYRQDYQRTSDLVVRMGLHYKDTLITLLVMLRVPGRYLTWNQTIGLRLQHPVAKVSLPLQTMFRPWYQT